MNDIRLAMLGMVDGNGHPFSWSAIVNGDYDKPLMSTCGYPAISAYLDPQPPGNLGIKGARVTHVWCEEPAHSQAVADAAHIPNVVNQPEEVIGHVDAAIIATDIGSEHVDRARPFIEAGLPLFIDKPLTDNCVDLQHFKAWHEQGRHFLSTSCMRYAREFEELKTRMPEVGEVRIITVMMAKSWERYGIHAIEAVYPLLPAGGYQWVVNTGDEDSNFVHLHHRSGVEVLLVTVADLFGAFGRVQVAGTEGTIDASFSDTFYAFKHQLAVFVSYLKTGEYPFPFSQTCEQIAIVIAGIQSRERGGERIYLEEILA